MPESSAPRTLFEKVWAANEVASHPTRPSVLAIGLHLVHEVTSPQAFDGLRRRGIRVRRVDRTLATMDHSTPTLPKHLAVVDEQAQKQLAALVKNCQEFGVPLFDLDSKHQGIVHVIGPETGATQPGKTIVCGDSHTATHGAFGALAFGIGTSEVEHVLATQCLLQRRPKTMAVNVVGKLGPGVGAKDIILGLIAQIGVGGGTGHVIEYRGETISTLSMDERMTICNMSIEAGARAGMVAPDEKTYEYLKGRPLSPKGEEWEKALAYWKSLPTDEGASFDREVTLDASKLEPMITYGTHPGMGMGISQPVPTADSLGDEHERAALRKALNYMQLEEGKPLLGKPINVVFIGSCTNSRLEDLRAAAEVFDGRKVAEGVRALVVPGSKRIKAAAEAEGLDAIFTDAGAEWRQPGCSMCIAMNGDKLEKGQYSVSTSNRNFEGRQGKGSRTLLASPQTAAACAIAGQVSDVRQLLASGTS